MTQFLNVFTFGSYSPRIRRMIDRLENSGKSRTWYNNGIKIHTIKMDPPFRNIVTRFIVIRDFDDIEYLGKEDLDVTNSAILLLDATEEDVKEKSKEQVQRLRDDDDLEEILVLIMNAAPRKNDEGILSRRQAKYFITGMDNKFNVDLQYKEITHDPSDEDNEIIWEFVNNTISNHLT